MRILCPTDFSEHSKVALKESIKIANSTNGEIMLLAVYNIQKSSASFISLDEIVKQNTEEELLNIKKEFMNDLHEGIRLETSVIKGTAARMICAMAKSHNIDLIVMGTQGSTNMQNILLGSVTKSVFKSSEVPVLAIPETITDSGIGDRFLLALDSDPLNGKKTLGIIPVLHKAYNARLNVFHVSKKENLVPDQK